LQGSGPRRRTPLAQFRTNTRTRAMGGPDYASDSYVHVKPRRVPIPAASQKVLLSPGGAFALPAHETVFRRVTKFSRNRLVLPIERRKEDGGRLMVSGKHLASLLSERPVRQTASLLHLGYLDILVGGFNEFSYAAQYNSCQSPRGHRRPDK
jgi:hypothetical protein